MTPDRIDSNQVAIVKALRKIPGVTVEAGHDDILVGHRGGTYWFEVKNPDCVSPKTGEIQPSKIKDSQYKLLRDWRGHYKIMHCLDQILTEIGLEVNK